MPSYRSDRGQSATCGRDHTSCQVETFFALTHPVVPTRLRIANLLQAEKEVYVCDLCEVLGELQPKVSRHLSVLRQAELVQARSDGKWKFYALAAPPPSSLPRTLLRCVGSCLGEFEDLAADRARLAGIEPGLRCGYSGE
jgi:DNA-binding transcriptional ArsR family regulator